MKKILIFGAGLVSRPMVKYLLEKGHFLIVADMNKEKALSVVSSHPNANVVDLDVKNEEELDILVQECDIVVSLLPASMHLMVAKICIKRKKSLVTTSYQSAGMAELKTQIEESGIIVLNEMGLDPGLDHMSAMRIIERVHLQGGQVREFYSLCGALPAPASADNPLKHKFTWSPRGVMLASTNSALYLYEGKEVSVHSDFLFRNPFQIEVPEVGTLDVYPNRDSVAYIEEYKIPEVNTMLRGTIRLQGWCESMDAFKQLGLFDMQSIPMSNMSYFNLIERKIGTLYPDYTSQIAKHLNIDESSPAVQALRWLGFFSNKLIGKVSESPFNITCDLMFNKMLLKEHDQDMVILQHEMQVKYPDEREERITSLLVEYGSFDTDTAISRTVALPAAIVVDLILKDEIKLKGLLRPFMREIWEPVLNKLDQAGISFKETVKQLV